MQNNIPSPANSNMSDKASTRRGVPVKSQPMLLSKREEMKGRRRTGTRHVGRRAGEMRNGSGKAAASETDADADEGSGA